MTRLIHRTLSLSLSLLLTMATLGSIDRLSQPDAGAPQWAQRSSHPTA